MTPKPDTRPGRPRPASQAAVLAKLRAKGLGLAPVLVDGRISSGKAPGGTARQRRAAGAPVADLSHPGPITHERGARPADRRTAPQAPIAFTVHGEPVSKGRARFKQQGGRMVSYTPQKTVDAERAVAAAFRAAAPGYAYPADAAYTVEAVFHNGTRRHRDVDNMLKLILDGLNGVAWADDWQVVRVEAAKVYAPGAARSVVTVRMDLPTS